MRRMAVKRLLLLVLLGCAPIVHAQTQAPPAAVGESSFKTFLAEWESAQARLLEGDAAQWKRMSSQGGDATIMGAFGGFEKGWDEVGPRYDWAAAQYRERKVKVQTEYLSVSVSGDLAFTVASFAPQDPRAAAKEMGRAINTLKLNGFIVNSHTDNAYLDQPRFWPTLEIDYPYQPTAPAVKFLETAPLSDQERMQIAHANAERIFRIRA